jgi:hypothetical protein
VNQNTADIAALDSRVTTNEADIDTLELDLAAAEAETLALDSRVTANEGNITSLDSRVTIVEGSIVTLGSDLTVAEADIASLESQVASNDLDISALQSTDLILGGRLTQLENLAAEQLMERFATAGNVNIWQATPTIVPYPNPKEATGDLVTYNTAGADATKFTVNRECNIHVEAGLFAYAVGLSAATLVQWQTTIEHFNGSTTRIYQGPCSSVILALTGQITGSSRHHEVIPVGVGDTLVVKVVKTTNATPTGIFTFADYSQIQFWAEAPLL